MYKHLFIYTRMYVHRLFVWRGVGSGMEATQLVDTLSFGPSSHSKTSCICKVAFPKEGFDQRNLLSWDQEGWVQVNPFYIVKQAGLASRIRVPLVNCCSKARNAETALGPLLPQNNWHFWPFFASHIFCPCLALQLHFIPYLKYGTVSHLLALL